MNFKLFTERLEDFKNAKVVGYFSMPHASLAEHNPEGYNNVMRGMPPNAGTCAHCGTGILHHVVVQTPDGQKHFIGTSCAERLGGEVGQAVRSKQTSEQKAASEAKRNAEVEKYQKEQEARKEQGRKNAERFKDVLEVLLRPELRGDATYAQNPFFKSLAEQLILYGKLSENQARYAVKAKLGRETKKNSDEWNKLFWELQGEEFEG